MGIGSDRGRERVDGMDFGAGRDHGFSMGTFLPTLCGQEQPRVPYRMLGDLHDVEVDGACIVFGVRVKQRIKRNNVTMKLRDAVLITDHRFKRAIFVSPVSTLSKMDLITITGTSTSSPSPVTDR